MCCAYCSVPYVFRFFCINACQSLSTRGAHPTIERSIRFLSTFSFWSWFEVNGQVKRPNEIVGVMTESKRFQRNLKDTCQCRSVSLCSLNFIQAIWLRCCKSTMALFRRSPDNFLPKYLSFCPPCSTSITKCTEHWFKEFLLGIHLSDTVFRAGDRTPGTIKSKLFVDTKVWDHG